MASLRDIRKRIKSVKSTRQITRAVKMVAAAKLRRAQDAIISARPYASTLDKMIAEVMSRAENGNVAHPLLVKREVKITRGDAAHPPDAPGEYGRGSTCFSGTPDRG